MNTYADYMKNTIITKINEVTDEGLIRLIYTMLMESITSNTKVKKESEAIIEKQAANS